MEDKITIFWHICGINHWKEIAKDQFNTIQSSGLLDRADRIMVTFLGKTRNEISWLETSSKKVEVNNYSADTNHYERMCLNGLREWSFKNTGLALYIHAKGVSRIKAKNKPNVWGWRKLLEYFLVENHERCTNEIRHGLDTLGGNLCIAKRRGKETYDPGHSMHYSGNFWWARPEYVRTLPKIPENVRMQDGNNYINYCEYWLLAPFPNVSCGVNFKTRVPHYYDSYPEPDYKEKGWLEAEDKYSPTPILQSGSASPAPASLPVERTL